MVLLESGHAKTKGAWLAAEDVLEFDGTGKTASIAVGPRPAEGSPPCGI